jgi:DNA modification methylase
MNPTSEADIERKEKYGKSYAGRRSNLPDYGSKKIDIQPGSASFEMQFWHYQWAVEALRILKPGGYLLAFGGTRTFHRLACALEDAGFEFRDTVCWLYGSGFPKSLDGSKMIDKKFGVEREVVGEKHYYSLNLETFEKINNVIGKFLNQ